MEYRPKVLVVDDNVFIVAVIEKILESTGYEIIKAYDGEEALKKAAEEEPDIILLDIIMPKIDGFEVCRRLKSGGETSMVPIVMLTSRDKWEDKVAGFESGADDYITKPFNPQEFIARIKGLVDKRIYQHQKVEQEKLEALENMVEGVAHEVRNPIVAIGGFARRISEKLPLGNPLHVYVDHIVREVERLENMVNEIINLKTIVISIRDQVNIEETVSAALKDAELVLAEKKIKVYKKFAPEIALLKGDRKNLQGAFFNVIENAVEAMQEGGSLTIEIEFAEKRIIVSIADSGKGIPGGEISRVIRPFYTSKMTGAGMGLAMVHHIVSLHGGDVNISSKKGAGTKVAIGLPVRDYSF